MAIVVFSKAAGQVSSFVDPTLPARTTLRVQGWGGFLGFKSIISRVTVSARGNFQFLHTLGGQVFVYVFGDKIGQLGISGLSFDSVCEDPAGTLGIERVLNYYSGHRIAARQTPVKVTIGTATTLSGYLLGITGDVVDPKSRIWQFNMEFALIPTDDIDEDSGTPDFDSATIAEAEPEAVLTGGTFPPPITDAEFEDWPELTRELFLSSTDTGGNSLSAGLTVGVNAPGFASLGSGPKSNMVLPVVR